MCKWSGCKLHVNGVLLQDFCLLCLHCYICCFVLHVSLPGSPPFLHTFLTVLFQVKATGSGGRANIAWLSEAGLTHKKKTTLAFTCRSGEVTFGSAVCNTYWGMWKASNAHVGPFPPFPCGISRMLLSWATHCPMRAYAYCMFLEQTPCLVWTHDLGCFHDILKFTSSAEPSFLCTCITYAYVCPSGKEGQMLHRSCCQGKQTKKAETTERLEMRVAIWGNLIHSPALHHRWGERHTWVISWADTSSWVRMRMQSTHPLGHACTWMYVCVTVYVKLKFSAFTRLLKLA